jgi:putative flippase GtrA
LIKLNQETLNSFIKFAIIGFLVFFIDFIFYQCFAVFFRPLTSRFFSYSFATWIAWYLNRQYSFSNISGTFLSYYLGASVAGIQNIAISNLLISSFGGNYIKSLIFIGIGCIYGLGFNFLFQSKITFRHKRK